METQASVIVRPGEADRILAGHPWVYEGAVMRITQAISDGEMVLVKDHRHRFLGMGFFNGKSKIRVRIIARDKVTVNLDFFETRIRQALEWREKYLPGASSYRVVNAEGDFMSGLIVDKYEDILVLQTSSLGMDMRKTLIIEALKRVFNPRAIVERNDIGSRAFEGMPDAHGLLYTSEKTDSETPLPSLQQAIQMNGLKFLVDLAGGHKTGFYLDQQINYQRIAELTRGARVLDGFCFNGGFGLHAAKAGALRVHCLDQSQEAVDAAKQNAKENGLDDRCTFETVNVFDWLKAQTMTGPNEKLVPKFDIIILDPPSFTRSRSTVPEAMRGYKEIHLRAFKLVKPGGTVATFCCSHHVDSVKFQEVISEAAFDARRLLRRIATYIQAPDHPIIPTIPETEYLKGFAFEVLN